MGQGSKGERTRGIGGVGCELGDGRFWCGVGVVGTAERGGEGKGEQLGGVPVVVAG